MVLSVDISAEVSPTDTNAKAFSLPEYPSFVPLLFIADKANGSVWLDKGRVKEDVFWASCVVFR